MANTRALFKRRAAVTNIRKITRTMELIATARFKKAMDRATEAELYTRKLAELVADLRRAGETVQHPLLEARPTVKRSLLLVLAANRGLCGGFNANVLRLALRTLQQTSAPVQLEVAGKRGLGFFRFRRLPVDQAFTQFDDKPAFAEVEQIANRYLRLFLNHQIDEVKVVFTRFLSAGRQEASVQTLLPMGLNNLTAGKSTAATTPTATTKTDRQIDFLFEPSASAILNDLLPATFRVQLFKCFLDSAVSEQIARMVAMKGATENANNLIKTLTQRYNRARQGQITSELAEIIGTAEALK